jgi:hypothetical protein
MRKKLEYGLKSEKRERKKRPRMRVNGVALKRPSKYAGLKIATKKN